MPPWLVTSHRHRLGRSALCVLALARAAACFFVVPMGLFPLVSERVDPIVTPGGVSGHAHAIYGGSNFDFELTTEKLRASKCTGAPIGADKSSYWLPQMYFAWSNGSYTSLTGSLTVYWHFEDQAGVTKAFPDDFSMRAGDPARTSYDSSRYDNQAVDYRCVPTMQDTPGYSPTNCPGGMRAQVSFPRCWDGKRNQASDNSHVSYPTDKVFTGPAVLGTCPDTHPVKLPHLFYEMAWYTDPFKDDWDEAANPSSPFVLANGDTKGYSAHGDFFNGWDSKVLQAALDDDSCHITANSGGVYSDCAPLKPSLQPSGTCFLTSVVDEPVLGTIPFLPGRGTNTEGDFSLLPATAWTGDGHNPPAGACKLTNGDLGSLPSDCTRAPAPKASGPPATLVSNQPSPGDPSALAPGPGPSQSSSTSAPPPPPGFVNQARCKDPDANSNALIAKVKRRLVRRYPRH